MCQGKKGRLELHTTYRAYLSRSCERKNRKYKATITHYSEYDIPAIEITFRRVRERKLPRAEPNPFDLVRAATTRA